MDTLLIAFAYAAGLLGPSAKSFMDSLLLGRIKKKERQEENAGSRADEAAVACLAALAVLREKLHLYVREKNSSRSVDNDDHRALEREVQESLRTLHDNLLLLPTTERHRMLEAHKILQDVDDLTDSGGWASGPFHPDGAWTMSRATIDDARKVLAAFRRHEAIPVESQSVYEYKIALAELQEEREAEFAQEISEQEDAIAKWRQRHAISGKERPSTVD